MRQADRSLKAGFNTNRLRVLSKDRQGLKRVIGMAKSRPIVVAYDISKNKVRARVRKVLREWNLGNQKSVYECRLTRAQAEELFLQLSYEIDEKTDNLLMAWLEPRRKILTRGLGRDTSMGKKLFHIR